MPITKDGNNVIQETEFKQKALFDKTGVVNADEFAICDDVDRLKQIQLDPSSQATDTTVTLKSGAAATDITLTLPATSGTLALTGGSGASFTTIQPDSGTAPVATSSTDTLTITSSDGSISVSGNSTTDTIDLKVKCVEVFTGHIQTAGNSTYVIDQSAAYGYTINTLIIASVSGTCTAKLQIGGVDVTGISSVSVSSTPATGTASAANTVSATNKVTLVLSSNSSAVDVTFTIKVTRT